ncbi:MAG: serine/threonine protein phosphatase [Hyphomicrobiales bacterium]|nr:serine/threonine protein phosphatase [Hyphomicrobiales bacterium]
MMKFSSLLASRRARHRRRRIAVEIDDIVVYAIGDVHGCLGELLELEAMIVADSAGLPAGKLIVMLGDYVDRGPSSAQVLDHLTAPPPDGFERLCLAGNHEIAMLDYLEGRISRGEWLRMGASPTLTSYGMDYERLKAIYGIDGDIDGMIRATIPSSHRSFLHSLPMMATGGRIVFVHAGIRPERSLDQQTDMDLVTIRSGFFDQAHLLRNYVVHGHTPVDRPARDGKRINIDTGAYYSGRLSAVRIWRGRGRFLATEGKSSQIESAGSR